MIAPAHQSSTGCPLRAISTQPTLVTNSSAMIASSGASGTGMCISPSTPQMVTTWPAIAPQRSLISHEKLIPCGSGNPVGGDAMRVIVASTSRRRRAGDHAQHRSRAGRDREEEQNADQHPADELDPPDQLGWPRSPTHAGTLRRTAT